MKVRDVMNSLQKANPEMDVCFFSELGVLAVDDICIYEGDYKRPLGDKLIRETVNGCYVGIGNPGNFDDLATHAVCKPLRDLANDD